jgi:hypothetical protein
MRRALDRALEEIVFAAVHNFTERDAVDPGDEEAERAYLLQRARDLDARLSDTSYMLSRGTIGRDRYDELADEILTERHALDARLRDVAHRRDRPALEDGTSLRELWPDLDVNARREWVAIVIEGGTLKASQKRGVGADVSSRLEIRFRDGYEPPMEELRRVLEQVDEELRLTRSGRERPSTKLADRLLELNAAGVTRDEIAKTLREEGWKLPSRGTWNAATVTTTLKRVCAERGLEYVPPSPGRRGHHLTDEGIKLMSDIFRRTQSWKETALELNRLGMRRPEGGDWTGRSLQLRLRYHAHRLGLELLYARDEKAAAKPGRPPYLDPTTREMIWHKHRIDGLSLAAVGAWLAGLGIRNAAGGSNWSKSSVLHIVRSVDEEARRTRRDTDEAA